MELYFAEGADLSDPRVLIQAAVDCGMDGDLVRRLLASDADVERIETEVTSAKEAGIDGVPCFIFGSSVIVTGAQSPEYLSERYRADVGPAHKDARVTPYAAPHPANAPPINKTSIKFR